MNRILALMLAAFMVVGFSSNSFAAGDFPAPKAEDIINIKVKSGIIRVQLLPDIAPKHVAQIKILVARGFYNDTPIHRVIPNFMAQMGDPTGTGAGGSELPDLPAEFTDKYKFERGIVGMARSANPNSANSQFFIMFDKASNLDGQYTIVGRVIRGMGFVSDIKQGSVRNNGTVDNPDKIIEITLEK